ncbi:GTPase [Paenibacillus herberti]|uniref:GTPase n=1 Tax=Paenibacillus herberti TaxID=1619309 RepID=UPI001FE73F03|nr:GTPase [Paenibacillus herberti]
MMEQRERDQGQRQEQERARPGRPGGNQHWLEPGATAVPTTGGVNSPPGVPASGSVDSRADVSLSENAADLERNPTAGVSGSELPPAVGDSILGAERETAATVLPQEAPSVGQQSVHKLDTLLPPGEAWEKEWRRVAEAQYDQNMAEIARELDQDILIALVGDVNAGKSSTLNRIVGEEVAGVGAEPGQTTVIRPYLFKDRIFFVDTPGLNDVRLENSQLTMDYYRKADIILFFLNAAGTVYSEVEKRNFEAIRDTNPNILLVLNKIDAADDIERLEARLQLETGGRFDIVSVSSRTGENIDKLRDAILELLRKKSKDLLFARNIKEKSTSANKWILGAAASASAIGAAPIPGADIVPITAVQIGLLTRLAVLYGRPISKETAKELVIATVVGNIGKSVFRQVIKLFPGAGSIAGASVAGAMTLALGYAVKYAYENEMDVNTATISKLYGIFRKQANS